MTAAGALLCILALGVTLFVCAGLIHIGGTDPETGFCLCCVAGTIAACGIAAVKRS